MHGIKYIRNSFIYFTNNFTKMYIIKCFFTSTKFLKGFFFNSKRTEYVNLFI